MADKSSTSNRTDGTVLPYNHTSADATDSTERFKNVHRHKRQKAMDSQGWREWQAASTRSNSLRVGPDGIVRPVGGGAATGSGCNNSRGGGDSAAAAGTSNNSGVKPGLGTEATRHSSLPSKIELTSAVRSAQKRKINWNDEDEDAFATNVDDVGPTASNIPAPASGPSRGSSVSRSNTTVAQRNNGLKPYKNVHPSRMGNLGLGDTRPCTNREQEGLQFKSPKDVDTFNEETKAKVIDDFSSADSGRYPESQAFPRSGSESAYHEVGPDEKVDCIDIAAREASLRRREVLLDISEQSIMSTRTQVLESIDQALTASTEARHDMKLSTHSSLFPDDKWPASPSSAGNHENRSYARTVTSTIEATTDSFFQFEERLLDIEKMLLGQR